MPLGCLAFSPEGKRIAAGELFGSGSCRIQLIDADSCRPIWEQAIPVEKSPDHRAGVWPSPSARTAAGWPRG